MLSFVLGLAIACLLVYLTFIFGNASFGMLGFTAALLMVLSFCCVTRAGRAVRLKLDIPLFIVERDREFGIRTSMKSKDKSISNIIRVCIRYHNILDDRHEKVWVTLSGSEENEAVTEYRAKIGKSGYYEFAITKYRVYDFFGLFYRQYRPDEKAGVVVLPDIYGIGLSIGDNLRNFYGDSDTYYKTQPGYDPSETYDVREYRNGDRLSKVHWKMSVKKDELIVREDSLPMVCAVVMFVVVSKGHGEGLFENLASLSFALVNSECPHYIAWYSKINREIVRARVESEESYYQFLIEFMQDCQLYPQDMADIVEMYEERFRGDNRLHEFRLEGDNILLDGELQTITDDTVIILN